MIVEPVTEAEVEIDQAFAYYRRVSIELAQGFGADLTDTTNRILALPNAHPPIGKGLRRCLLSRFPYQIVYRVEGDVIRVYALAHLKRRPAYWLKRVRS